MVETILLFNAEIWAITGAFETFEYYPESLQEVQPWPFVIRRSGQRKSHAFDHELLFKDVEAPDDQCVFLAESRQKTVMV